MNRIYGREFTNARIDVPDESSFTVNFPSNLKTVFLRMFRFEGTRIAFETRKHEALSWKMLDHRRTMLASVRRRVETYRGEDEEGQAG